MYLHSLTHTDGLNLSLHSEWDPAVLKNCTTASSRALSVSDSTASALSVSSTTDSLQEQSPSLTEQPEQSPPSHRQDLPIQTQGI